MQDAPCVGRGHAPADHVGELGSWLIAQRYDCVKFRTPQFRWCVGVVMTAPYKKVFHNTVNHLTHQETRRIV